MRQVWLQWCLVSMFYFWAQASYVLTCFDHNLLDILFSCILFECAIVYRPQRSFLTCSLLAGHTFFHCWNIFPHSSIIWTLSSFLLMEIHRRSPKGSTKDLSKPFLKCLCLLTFQMLLRFPSRHFNKHIWFWFWKFIREHRTKQKKANISLFHFIFLCICSCLYSLFKKYFLSENV